MERTVSMKKLLMFGLGGLLLLLIIGCGEKSQEVTTVSTTMRYYLDVEKSKLIGEEYALDAHTLTGAISEMRAGINGQEGDSKKLPLLPANVIIRSAELNGDTLWVNFSAEYYSMEAVREILVRAGIVRSFANIEGINSIGFMVESEELFDVKGEPVGLMQESNFVEDSGKDVNAYQYVTMKLYFANKEGDRLVLEERKIYYSKNTPLERAVVEQLLDGPHIADHYPTIPTETKILSVLAMGGLGYVNLDQAFLHQTVPVQGEVAIQSIVRSIIETCSVDKVQISINGETKMEFRDNISFDQFFEINDLLVEVEE